MARPRTKPRRTTKSPALLRERIAELERERELLNSIANDVPSLICLVDDEGRVRPYASNKDRAAALGEELAVDSPPGGGTRLRADLPLTI